jgi:hypothetical protein
VVSTRPRTRFHSIPHVCPSIRSKRVSVTRRIINRRVRTKLITILASILSHQIGYGNAAGLLFHKGISAPPPARIDEISTTTPRNMSIDSDPRNPITSLQTPLGLSASSAENHDMTEEEKEREAERLFVLFERMEKNPVLKARGDDGAEKGVKEVMRRK